MLIILTYCIHEKYRYLHITFTLTSWFTRFPYPLSALQWYVPEAVLLMFVKFHVDLLCSTSLLLPPSSTLVQVIFGSGLPVALQSSVTFDPSRTVWSPLTLVSWTGTKSKNYGRPDLEITYEICFAKFNHRATAHYMTNRV